MKKNTMMITQFLKKVHNHSHWKRNQDATYWVKRSRAQDQGLQFWQTKSHAIIVHSPVPADCIHRVISQNEEIPKNPWLTFEQFKDTFVEKQLTLS